MRFDWCGSTAPPAACRSSSTCPACTTCSTPLPRSRWPPRWGAGRGHRQGAGRVQRRRRPALPALRRGRLLPGRRHGGSFTLIDDYGHHPVGDGGDHRRPRRLPGRAWCWPSSPIATRAPRLLRGFRQGAVDRDALVLAEVYAAGETPIVAADGRSLARARCASPGSRAGFSSRTSPTCRSTILSAARRRRRDHHGAGSHRRGAGQARQHEEAKRPGSERCGAVPRFTCRARGSLMSVRRARRAAGRRGGCRCLRSRAGSCTSSAKGLRPPFIAPSMAAVARTARCRARSS